LYRPRENPSPERLRPAPRHEKRAVSKAAKPIHFAIPDTVQERQKWSHFGPDLGHYQAKTPKKGPKMASYSYLSVNYYFMYSYHS
jgi:hypothetical protein